MKNTDSPRQHVHKSPTNKDVKKKKEAWSWIEGEQLDLSLEQLNDNCSLTDLANILKSNTSITQINVAGGYILTANGPISTALAQHPAFKGDANAEALGIIWVCLARNTLLQDKTLTSLDLKDRHIGFKAVNSLAALITETTLKNLDLTGNSIGNKGAKTLAKVLTKNTTLTHLGLCHNRIDHKGVVALAKALKTNTSLTQLDLSCNHVGSHDLYIASVVDIITSDEDYKGGAYCGIGTLADMLQDNHTLRILNLKNTLISGVDVEYLAPALKKNTALMRLDLSDNYINLKFNPQGTHPLIEAFNTNTTLEQLDLQGNPVSEPILGAIQASIMSNILHKNNTLAELDLSNRHIGVSGLKVLAAALKTHTTLTQLNLSGNHLSAEGASLLAKALIVNTSLAQLHLADNVLGPQGIQVLAKALKTNRTITWLDLGANKIDSKGAQALVEALKINTALEQLDLEGNFISDRLLGAIQIGIMKNILKNSSLTELKFSKRNVGAAGMEVLAEALKTNRTFTRLELADNRIGSQGMQALAKVLKTNSTVTWLDLSDNGIGTEGAKALVEALETNTTLEQLDLEDNPISEPVLDAIQASIARNILLKVRTSTEPDLSNRHIGVSGLQLLGALKTNVAFAQIDLTGNHIDTEGPSQRPLDLIAQSPHNLHNQRVETTKYLLYVYRQEQRLKQLNQQQVAERLAQTQAVPQQQARTLAAEAEALRQALLTLSTEDGFGVLRQAAWRAFRQVKSALPAQLAETCQLQLQLLEPPALLLKFNEHSLAKKAMFFMTGSLDKHPIFTRLNQRRKTLKALNQTLTATGASALAAVLADIIANDQAYIQQACKTAPDKGKPLSERFMVLYAADLPPRLLRSEAQSLFAKMAQQSREASNTAFGTSLVRLFQGIHFKHNPYAPGVEFMVSALGRLLVGRVITPSELIKVLDTGGYSLPYLASRAVVGVELGHIIREHPDYLNHLRADNFSAIVLLSLLIDPQDGQPDHYMAEIQTNEAGQLTSLEIISIGHGIAFGEPCVYHHTTGAYQGKSFVTVKNVLYFFPQMATPLDTALRERLLKLEPAERLLTWLQALQDKNQHYQQLWEEGVFTTQEFCGGKTRGMQLPIRLRPGTVTRLYQKLRALQAYLSKHPEATHQALFQALEPDLFQHYQAIQTKYPNDMMHCLRRLYLQAQPTAQERHYLSSQLRSQQTAALTHAVLESPELKMLEAQQTQPTEAAVMELLALLDFERFNTGSSALLDEQSQRLQLRGVSDSYDPLALYRYMLEQQYCSEAYLKHLLTQRGLLPQNTYLGGDTPLHLAVQHSQQTAAIILLEYGADVNHTNDAGYSPLHVAASQNDLPMVKLLLQAGADKEKLLTKAGDTPLDIALSNGHEAIALWLLEQGAKGYLPLYQDKVAALRQLPKVPVVVASPPSSSTLSTAALLTGYGLLSQHSGQFPLSGNVASNTQAAQSPSPQLSVNTP
jgi:Ran GTPase-activating protein (RanGAP) involved in mRNA processing and transport